MQADTVLRNGRFTTLDRGNPEAQLDGSLLVIWGGCLAWLGAGALGVFTVLATLIAHAWWTKAGIERFRDFNTFWEHAGLVGGFMLAAVLASRRLVAQRP
jgi:transmembrane protein